ncbi:MAG: hypothetical protein IT443_06555 [Phycisphaeraceae bacterium]|nr:hypothetical protein [Phycisphaeraceae bacterium]
MSNGECGIWACVDAESGDLRRCFCVMVEISGVGEADAAIFRGAIAR